MKLTGGKRSGRQRLIIGLLTTLFLVSLYSQLGPQLSYLPNLPKIIAPSLPVGIRDDLNQIAKVVEPIFAGIPKLNWVRSSAQTYENTGTTQCSGTAVGDTCGASWSGRPTTVSISGTVTTGDTLVLELNAYSAQDAGANACSGNEITDTESNSWTLAGTGQAGPDSQFDVDFYAKAASTSSSYTVTVSTTCMQYMGTTPAGAGGFYLFDMSGMGSYSTDYVGNEECSFSGSTTTAKCYGGIGTGSVGGGTTENPAGDTVLATEEQVNQPASSCSAVGWTPSEGPGCATWSYGSACAHSCSNDAWGWIGDWSGGADSFELECSYLGSGTHYCTQVYYAENVLVFNPPSVTLPITCTSTNGSPTVSLSGGSPSPSTAACSAGGTTTDISLNPSTTVTATVPANVSTTSYVFQISSAPSLTATNAGCSSGTCSTWSLEIYQQLENTYQVSAPQGTFSTGLTWKVTDTSAGESSVNICTISSTIAGSDSCNGWGDYDQTATIPQAATGAASNTRWQSSAACTFTPTTGGNTENCNSYFQLSNTYQASTNGQGPPTWDSGLSAVVTGSLYGSTGQNICTISPSSGTTTTASCTGYADYDAAVSEPSTMSGAGSNIQWKVYGASSWTDTTGGDTHTGTYYKQLQNTYQVTAETQSAFDTSMSWVITGTVGGTGSSTICTISSTAAATDSCTGYADYDLGVTIPQAATSPPANTRWQSSAACTFTQTSGGNTNNCNSYKQLDNTYQASTNGQGPPTWDSGLSAAVTGSFYGFTGQTICTISPSSGTMTTAACTGYADYDAAVSEPSTMSGAGSNIQWEIYGTSSWTDITGGNTHTGTYYKQLDNTYQVTAKAQSTFDTSMSWVVTGTVGGTGSSTVCTISSTASGTDSCSGYADYNLGVTIPQASSTPPSNTRWQSSAACTFTQTTGGNTNNCNSYKQLDNTYDVSTNGNGPPTWDSGLSAVVSGTLYGVSGQTVCTISPTSGTTTTASCSGYADYDLAVSEPSTMSGAASGIRWAITGTSSWTDTTGANTHTGRYYKQLDNTYQAVPNQRTTFDSAYSITVSGPIFGVTSQTVCTITTSNGGGIASCSGYADYDLAVSVGTISGAPSFTQWVIVGTSSFTDTTGSNTHSVEYYNEIDNTYQVTAEGQSEFDTGMAWTVTGTLGGSSGSTICTITSTAAATDSCSSYADYDQIVTIPQAAASPPANSRWQSTAACMSTLTTVGNVENCNSFKQWTNTYEMQVAGSVSAFTTGSGSGESMVVLGYLYGSSGQTICTATASSGPSATCSGYSDNAESGTLPQFLTGEATSTQWQNSNGRSQSSGSITSGANTFTASFYLQLYNTYQVSTNGQGPPTWDSGLTATATGTFLGVTGQTICTISPSSGTTTTAGCSGYVDYDRPVSEPATMSGAGSSIQWELYGTSSWTDTTAGNTHTGTYYKQLQNTYQVVANAQSTFDTGMSWVVTGTIGGVGSSTVCTITSTASATDSCSAYADYDLGVTIPQAASSPPSNTRWQSTSACTFTETTGGNTYGCYSYKQLDNTYNANPNAPTTFSASIVFTAIGTLYGTVAQTICTITVPGSPSSGSYSCSGYADYDTAVSLPSVSTSNASSVQWISISGTAFTDSTGGNSHTANYDEQLSNTYVANANTPTTFSASIAFPITGTQGGVSGLTICTITIPASPSSGSYSCSGYTDYDTTTSFPGFSTNNPSANVQWQSRGTITFTDTTGGNTHTVLYYEEIQNTFQVSAVNPASFSTGMMWAVTGTLDGSTGTLCTISSTDTSTDSCASFSDYGQTVIIPQAASSPPASTRWQSTAGCTYSPTTGGNTENCNSYWQLDNTYVVNPGVPTTFSPSISFPVTGSLYGVAGQTICTISVPSSPSSGTYDCSSYADYNTPTTIAASATGAPTNQRWEVSGTNTFTDVTAGNSHQVNYYLQDSITVSYSIVDGAGSSSAPILTYVYLGSSGATYTITTTPTVVWQDDGQAWTSTNPLTGSSSTERWYADSDVSGTSSAGETIDPAYYNQFYVTAAIALPDSGSIPRGDDPTFSYTQFGGSVNFQVSSSTSTWADNAQEWTFTPAQIVISPTERFDSLSTTSGTISSSESFTLTYYHQFKIDFSYSISGSSEGSSPPTFNFFFEGSTNSTTLSTSPADLWLDAIAVWNVTNPLIGSNTTTGWQTATPTGSTTSNATTNIVYDLEYGYITLLNPNALTITYTNASNTVVTSSASVLYIPTSSTFKAIGSNFNAVYTMNINGSAIYQVPSQFGNGIQVFSTSLLNPFNFTTGQPQPFLNMTATSATVIVLDPVPDTGLSYVSTTVAGLPYSPAFSQSNALIQVTTTGTQNILIYFVAPGHDTTACSTCGGETTQATSSSSIATSGQQQGGTSAFVQNAKVDLTPGNVSRQMLVLTLNNAGSSAISELTQISFSQVNNTAIDYNATQLPISVASGGTGNIPVILQTSGLSPGSYTINGNATFTQYSSSANTYVTLHSGFTITLFVAAIHSGDGTNFSAGIAQWWWAILTTVILIVIAIGLLLRHKGY